VLEELGLGMVTVIRRTDVGLVVAVGTGTTVVVDFAGATDADVAFWERAVRATFNCCVGCPERDKASGTATIAETALPAARTSPARRRTMVFFTWLPIRGSHGHPIEPTVFCDDVHPPETLPSRRSIRSLTIHGSVRK
jgi:hypothetical protein